MASSLKGALKSATGRSTSPSKDPQAQEEASKYRLRVTAGGAYDTSTHKPVHVNTGRATYIENDFLRAKVQVRIRNYRGLPTSCPSSSPYFDHPSHEKDQYSLAFSFVPKVDLPSVDTVWGNDFDHPVRDRLPPGFNTAFRIVKEFIDPGLSCDAYADEPWLYGPSLSCWFAFVVGEEVGQDGDFAAPGEEKPMREGGEGSGEEVRAKLGIPENNEKRRKYFLDAKHREQFTFEKGRCYQADFYNPYLDFGNYALKLPRFSLKVIKYVDQKSHNLRYVFKNRQTGDVYLNVNFGLLWGDDLKNALEAEKHGEESAGHEANGQTTTSNAEEERAIAIGEAHSTSPQAGEHYASSGERQNLDIRDKSKDGPDVPSRPEESEDKQSASAQVAGTDPTSVQPSNAPATNEIAGHLQVTATCDRSQQSLGNIAADKYPNAKPGQTAAKGTSNDSPEVMEISEMLQASATSDRRESGQGIL